MNTVRRSILAVIVILASQIVFALIIAPALKVDDFFPYHRWALFAKAWRSLAVPIVYIHSYQGIPVEPEMSYYDFFAGREDIDFLAGRDHLVWWQDALNEGDAERASLEYQAFVENFFLNSKAKFSIRYQRVDQIKFLKNREVLETIKEHGPFHYPSADKERD
jgi:hypothetical protein